MFSIGVGPAACVECSRTHILAKVTQTGQLPVEMGKIKSKS